MELLVFALLNTTEGAPSRPCGTAPPLVGSLNAVLAFAAPRIACVAGGGKEGDAGAEDAEEVEARVLRSVDSTSTV